MSTDRIETEVKFLINDPACVRERLLSLGACDRGRVFESNTCYDTPQGTIAAEDRLLRLRRDTAVRLTLKSKPAVDEYDVKAYRELELEIGDFDTMEAILGELGYHPARTYEKWRHTYALQDVLLCLDTLPFGEFLEIEGEKHEIRQTADHLGFNWNRRILTNYLAIFDLVKERLGLPFTDPTFVNFQRHRATGLGPVLAELEAGNI